MNLVKKMDAGWNDPPNFSYCENAEFSRSPKRSILNKRVAFPINSTANINKLPSIDPTSTPTFKHDLPPPPTNTGCPPISVPNESSTLFMNDKFSKLTTDDSELLKSNDSETNVADDAISLDEVLTNLNTVIEEKNDLLKTNNKHELIKKKLLIMEDSWKNKLPVEIKGMLLQLSEAIKNKDKETANQIHINLMVDHPKLCSEFISVFRQLINTE